MTELTTLANRFNTIFIGMDVHKCSVSLYAYVLDHGCLVEHKIVSQDYHKDVLQFIQEIRGFFDTGVHVVCGYEAGCTGYALCRFLRKDGIDCKVIAPNTIPIESSHGRVKTDRRDAQKLARSLAFGTYKTAHVPTQEEEAVRDYMRMRDDHKHQLKRVKQQILALCLRNNLLFDATRPWTLAHHRWLDGIIAGTLKSELPPLKRETLQEYMTTYDELSEKIAQYDKRIQELSQQPEYLENVKNLRCIKGLDTLSAMTVLVEVGDLNRFESAEQFTSFVGLTPGEYSSGEKEKRLGITKAGNGHVRHTLVECAQSYNRGTAGKKSSKLRARQKGCDDDVIKYADRASKRLRKKYMTLTVDKGKSANVAKTAVARELACFIWGMVTGRIATCQNGKSNQAVSASPKDPQGNHERQGSVSQDSRGKPLSLRTKKEVSPEPPSRKKPRGAAPKSMASEAGQAKTPQKTTKSC